MDISLIIATWLMGILFCLSIFGAVDGSDKLFTRLGLFKVIFWPLTLIVLTIRYAIYEFIIKGMLMFLKWAFWDIWK